MKKTTLTLMAMCLLLLAGVSVQAQHSPEAQAAKANLVEVQANLADLQERFPSSPDIPLFQEKEAYLIQLLEQYSANGTAGDVMITRSEDKTASALYEEKVNAAAGNSRAPSTIQQPTEEKEVGMTAKQSQVWNLLQSTENQLARLQKSNADQATIKAYQSRVQSLKDQLGKSN